VRGRVRLPTTFAERIEWLAGEQALDAWLFVIAPGRYRLLSLHQVQGSEQLRAVLESFHDTVLADPSESDADPAAALPLRLIPTAVSPRGPGWRVRLPKEAIMLADPNEDSSHAYLLFSSGYPEIWLPDVARRAVHSPLGELL